MNTITMGVKALFNNKTLQKWKGLVSDLAKKRTGGLLIETVVAISLMTVVGTAVLSGLSTTHISGAKTERQSIAENIARNQMAAIFSASYEVNGDSYAPVALPASQSLYSVTAVSAEVDSLNPDPCIQRLIVNVRFQGQLIMDLESIKSDTLSGTC